MVVEAGPVSTRVHPVADRRPVDRGGTTAEPTGAFEHPDRHPRARQVAGDDGAVVAAADHHSVVSERQPSRTPSPSMKAAEYPVTRGLPESEQPSDPRPSGAQRRLRQYCRVHVEWPSAGSVLSTTSWPKKNESQSSCQTNESMVFGTCRR